MALSLQQKDKLTTSADFLSRVRQAVRDRAAYRLAGGGSPTQQQTDWAKRALRSNQAGQIAANLAGELVCDVAFNAATYNATGTGDVDTTDANISAAVSTYCENY